jgi:hypothetical protein
MSALLELISQWPVAAFLRQSLWAYPVVSALHILSIGLIVGAITTLDLRMLGVFRDIPLVTLARPLLRVAQTGIVMTVLSGFLLFSVQPDNYLGNAAFQIKLVLITLAIANALLVHQLPSWQRALDNNQVHPMLAAAALLSMLLWASTILAGRWIAFV